MLRNLIEEEIPTILFAQERAELSIDCVTLDDYLGGYTVTKYLLSLGHQRIAVLTEDAISSEERVRGYRNALKQSNINADEQLIRLSNTTVESASEVAGKLLDLEETPTAIFGCNDVLAVGAMMAAKRRE